MTLVFKLMPFRTIRLIYFESKKSQKNIDVLFTKKKRNFV